MSYEFSTARRSRRAFTLVELLVVIAIIGVLIAMLLPAVQAAREAARRSSCSNKLKQMGLGLHNYHDVFLTFPPDAIWTARNRPPAAQLGEERNFTWIALFLPFIEQAPLHSQIDFNIPALNQVLPGSAEPLRGVMLDTFLCPSDSPFPTQPHGFGYSSYGGNAGLDGHRRYFAEPHRAGVFTLLDAVGIQQIHDGTSNVFMVGEVTNRGFCCRIAGFTTWWDAGNGSGISRTASNAYFRSLLVAPAPRVSAHVWIDPAGGPLLNAEGVPGTIGNPTWASPHGMPPVMYADHPMKSETWAAASFHKAGANFCMADASVKFVRESISVGGVGGPRGNANGAFGNVWTGAHLIQGARDKTVVTFE